MSVYAATDHRLGLASQEEELAPTALDVQGQLPDWLGGTLVRVTPALLDPGGVPVNHWFDGLAMLNGFEIGRGGVTYTSRFLDSKAYRAAHRPGGRAGAGFDTEPDPCRSLFGRVMSVFRDGLTDNCNVNVVRLGEQWVALTETPAALEFDPKTLATLGARKWAGPAEPTTAHPHYDFARGEALSYATRVGPRPAYRVYAHPDGGKRREVARVAQRRPSYMHSFAVTDRWIVLIEQPWRMDPRKLMTFSSSFAGAFDWQPERGTTFVVIDRASGKVSRRVEAEPFFTFHTVNAFEEDGELVVDLCAYEDASIVGLLRLEHLRAGGALPGSHLRRYRLGGERAACELLCDARMELPRISYRRHNGRPYRYVYGAGGSGDVWFDQLVKADVAERSAQTWSAPGCHPGEPVFVARPDCEGEDDGVLLSVVLDAAAQRSFLLVADARDLSELARAEAPQVIPHGFHGDFARAG
jgi:carotenoid cleavage dioxygenase-like enzyme